MTEIQLFEVCVVVGYASYSDCNEISQVQLYLKLLRLKHSGGDQVAALRNAIAIYSSNGGINKTSLEYSNLLHNANHDPHLLR